MISYHIGQRFMSTEAHTKISAVIWKFCHWDKTHVLEVQLRLKSIMKATMAYMGGNEKGPPKFKKTMANGTPIMDMESYIFLGTCSLNKVPKRVWSKNTLASKFNFSGILILKDGRKDLFASFQKLD